MMCPSLVVRVLSTFVLEDYNLFEIYIERAKVRFSLDEADLINVNWTIKVDKALSFRFPKSPR
jgi:hypothetical protein